MELSEIWEKIAVQKEKTPQEYFWAVQVWDEGVKTAIWTIEQEKTKVVSLGNSEPWEEGVEELAVVVDKSLTSASENCPVETEKFSKVILGLPDSWSTPEGKIKPEKLTLVSGFCDKLDLKPVGFVSLFDAVNHRLQDVEGTPPSVILINPWKKVVNIALVSAGKIQGVESVVRSDNLGADVYEGLLRFENIDVLPARILLFNGSGMEEVRQILTSFPWQTPLSGGKKLPFFHLPKIEILPYDFDITAVALSGGREVAKSLGFAVTGVEEIDQSLPSKAREVQPAIEEEESTVSSEQTVDLGFVKGRDVAAEQENFPAEEIEPEMPLSEAVEVQTQETQEQTKETRETVIPEEEKEKKFSFSLPNLPSLTAVIDKFSFSEMPFRGIFLIIGGLLGIGAVFFFLWWNLPKANVVLTVRPETLEKDFELTIDPNQEVVDLSSSILPGKLMETKVSGEDSQNTTGEKTVGEKSKGEVTIYNRTDNSKTFPAGTVLIGPGSLKFTIDRETTVASKTPDLESGVDKWGESKVEVTAVDIGAQYNLAAASQFSVKDQPLTAFLAKNDSAFSGGTSRQIQAVSEKDQKDLTDKLTASLLEKGKIDLIGQIPQDRSLIEESLSNQVESAVFDHKVGEEAQTLALKLNLKIAGLTYKHEDFNALVSQFLSPSIPDGYSFKNEETNARFELKKKNADNSFLFRVYIKTNLLPKLNTDEILHNLRGKNPKTAKEYLSSLGGYVDSQINLSPSLPGFLGILPWQEKHISLEVRSQ